MEGKRGSGGDLDQSFAVAGAGSMGVCLFFRWMVWAHGCALVARVRRLREQSLLLLGVLAAFICGYLLVGYFLFHRGLDYVHQFPVVGTLLSQRILFLVFGFFFVMLVFSNVIVSYTTLFKNRETAWLLTLPVRHRHVYLWKFFEALVVSSWALLFLSAPMMVAYGRVHQVDAMFYLQVLFVCLPFVVLPAVIGSWCILLLVRVLSRGWLKKALIVLSIGLLAVIVWGVRPSTGDEAAGLEEVVSFERLLRHTRLSLNPGLPSSWAARSIVAAGQNLTRESQFYVWLLASNACFGLVLAYEIGGRLFYRCWSDAATTRTRRLGEAAAARRRALSGQEPLLDRLAGLIPRLSPSARAMLAKDVRVFWRDPAQWTQFAIFFGLLCMYLLNLRNVAHDIRSEFWVTVISYLNLGACALTLSTLTTRFVFPQFSLEGRRLWVIGMAPVGLPRVLLQKFWMSTISAGLATVSLMVASSVTLQLETRSILFFGLAIGIMSTTLSALAVSLGALFPNLQEDNPSRIVSGFGGTLCLIASFIYIVLLIGLLVLPVAAELGGRIPDEAMSGWFRAACYTAALILSAVVALLPLRFALGRVKSLEFS